MQYSTVQYSTVQYSTVQYSTVQYSTVQYSTVQWNVTNKGDLNSKVTAFAGLLSFTLLYVNISGDYHRVLLIVRWLYCQGDQGSNRPTVFFHSTDNFLHPALPYCIQLYN